MAAKRLEEEVEAVNGADEDSNLDQRSNADAAMFAAESSCEETNAIQNLALPNNNNQSITNQPSAKTRSITKIH